jgi:hypothetical protein
MTPNFFLDDFVTVLSPDSPERDPACVQAWGQTSRRL